jgi:CxxH/CxxC protein (TIGR04129 family)
VYRRVPPVCNFVDNVDNRNPTGPGEEWKRMDKADQQRWFACKAHEEWVLEAFVDEYQTAPSVDTVSPSESACCRMCGRTADRVFFLTIEEDTTGAAGDSGSR